MCTCIILHRIGTRRFCRLLAGRMSVCFNFCRFCLVSFRSWSRFRPVSFGVFELCAAKAAHTELMLAMMLTMMIMLLQTAQCIRLCIRTVNRTITYYNNRILTSHQHKTIHLLRMGVWISWSVQYYVFLFLFNRKILLRIIGHIRMHEFGAS